MKAKKFIPILCTFCLLFNVFFPLFKVNVCAENKVTLNFIGGSVETNKVCYSDNISDSNMVEIQLKAKQNDNGYEVCRNLSNGMQIDLSEKDYCLSILNCRAVGEKEWCLYIGTRCYHLSVGEEIELKSDEFNGDLNIEYKEKQDEQSDFVEIPISATFDGVGMNVLFNGERIGKEAANITATGKGYASGSDVFNSIKIQLAFGDGNIGSITVNGEEINIPEGTTDMLEFKVAPSTTYNLVVKKSEDNSNVPRTIIWASDKADNSSLKENELLKNGTVEILSIKDPDGNPIDMKCVNQDTEKNNGMAVIIPGSKVTFRLKPDYGYQLTSIKINDENLVAGEEQSTFEYIMPDTNIHFSGIFEKVEDKVKVKSDKVKDGTIELGGKEVDSGSVVLSVSDADLSKEQVSNFEEKADGYKISSYLNISLDQVLYKGTADDVWSNQLKELNNEATVSLNLEESMEGNEAVVVHEKDDGTYEMIPTVYDASSNTVTFKTSSFSNYAVASKMDSQIVGDSTGNDSMNIPQTGDDILKYVLLIVLALMVLGTVIVFKRQKSTKK